MRYFTDAGPDRGPLLYGTVPGAIGVLEALDKPMPIGMALSVGRDAAGSALWELAKGRSSRLLRQEFPRLRSRLPTLWTHSDFVGTVGGSPLAVVKPYLENPTRV